MPYMDIIVTYLLLSESNIADVSANVPFHTDMLTICR